MIEFIPKFYKVFVEEVKVGDILLDECLEPLGTVESVHLSQGIKSSIIYRDAWGGRPDAESGACAYYKNDVIYIKRIVEVES